MKCLKGPEIDPAVIFPHSPLLATLIDWVRVALRVVFLQHQYEDQPNIPRRLITEAQAMRFKMSSPPREFASPRPPLTPLHARPSRAFEQVNLPPSAHGFGAVTGFASPPPKPQTFSERLQQRPRTADAARRGYKPHQPLPERPLRMATTAEVEAVFSRTSSVTTARPQSAYLKQSKTFELGTSSGRISSSATHRHYGEMGSNADASVAVSPSMFSRLSN